MCILPLVSITFPKIETTRPLSAPSAEVRALRVGCSPPSIKPITSVNHGQNLSLAVHQDTSLQCGRWPGTRLFSSHSRTFAGVRQRSRGRSSAVHRRCRSATDTVLMARENWLWRAFGEATWLSLAAVDSTAITRPRGSRRTSADTNSDAVRGDFRRTAGCIIWRIRIQAIKL